MALKKGEMECEVLEDGTIRVETSDMGGPNHQSADEFLKEVKRLAGGEVTTEKVKSTHTHNHQHGGGHHHQH